MQVQNRQDPPRNEPEFLFTMKILSTYTLIKQRSLCRHSHVHFIFRGCSRATRVLTKTYINRMRKQPTTLQSQQAPLQQQSGQPIVLMHRFFRTAGFLLMSKKSMKFVKVF